jgi:hypothetical protein
MEGRSPQVAHDVGFSVDDRDGDLVLGQQKRQHRPTGPPPLMITSLSVGG